MSREVVEQFTRKAGVPDSSRALGWDTPSPNSSAGDRLSPRSFGHTGFTGTSMWIDPERKLFVILLTKSADKKIDRFEIGAPTLVVYDLKEHKVSRTIRCGVTV